MNLDWLRTFVVAADALNFTKAAEVLHLTQPAVSQHIKELEGAFKQPLFERRNRQVRLSQAGELLLPYARQVLSGLEEAHTVLSALEGMPSGGLAIGAGNTAGVYILPTLLGRFRAAHPHVRISLKVGQTTDLVDLLGHGELDLALLEEGPDEGTRRPLTRVPFLSDELVLIAPPDGPRGPLTPAELAGLPLLARATQSRTEQLIRAHLTAAGLAPGDLHVGLELGNTEAIKRGVMAGLGLGFVSRFAIADELADQRLHEVPVTGVHIERRIWIVTPERRVQPEAVRRFQAFLLDNTAAVAGIM